MARSNLQSRGPAIEMHNARGTSYQPRSPTLFPVPNPAARRRVHHDSARRPPPRATRAYRQERAYSPGVSRKLIFFFFFRLIFFPKLTQGRPLGVGPAGVNTDFPRDFSSSHRDRLPREPLPRCPAGGHHPRGKQTTTNTSWVFPVSGRGPAISHIAYGFAFRRLSSFYPPCAPFACEGPAWRAPHGELRDLSGRRRRCSGSRSAPLFRGMLARGRPLAIALGGTGTRPLRFFLRMMDFGRYALNGIEKRTGKCCATGKQLLRQLFPVKATCVCAVAAAGSAGRCGNIFHGGV